MPGVIYEDTLSDSGSATLSGNRVYYVAWKVTTEGFDVRQGNPPDTDSRLGVGYIAFGNDITSGGILSGDAWQPAMWLNWTQGQIIAEPQDLGGSFGRIIATRIHWAFSQGVEVHLYVFGDTV